MEIYELRDVGKNKKAWFRRPNPGETAREMRDYKGKYPVHEDDIQTAETREREVSRE